ncbi:Glycosyltransferase RgtA/B/C/D-like domain-containing protein [Frankia sp. AiPs1]
MVGVSGAALLFGALGLLVAAVMPPFASADEAQHTAYAFEVSHGRLPELDTPVRSWLPGMPGLPATCELSPAQARAAVAARARSLCGVRLGHPLTRFDLIYTANHPPLFYLVEGVPLRAGVALGHPHAGFRTARVLNIMFGMSLVVATAALCRALVPGRPEVTVGAAGIVGVVGMVVSVSGQVYNDTLATATVTGLLAGVVALARRGPRRWTLIGLALIGPAAAASRASGAVALVALLPIIGIGVALHTPGGLGRRAVRGLAAATGLLALVSAAIGWFYLRNIRLYGDFAASRRVAAMFPLGGRHPTVEQVLENGHRWRLVLLGLFGRPRLVTGQVERIALIVAVLTMAGLAVAVLRVVILWLVGLVARGTAGAATTAGADADAGIDTGIDTGAGTGGGGTARGRSVGRWGTVVAGVAVVGHCLIVIAVFVAYVRAGGAPFSRYLLPMVPVLAVLVAAAVWSLPLGRRFGLPTVAIVVGLAASTVVLTGRELAWKRPALASLGVYGRLRAGWAHTGPGWPPLGLGVLTGCAVCGLILFWLALGCLGHHAAVSAASAGPVSVASVPVGPVRAGAVFAGPVSAGLGDAPVDLGGALGGAPPGEVTGMAAAGLGIAGGGEQVEDGRGEIVGEAVPVRLPDQPDGAAEGGLGRAEQSADDLPDGGDVGGGDRDARREGLQGR